MQVCWLVETAGVSREVCWLFKIAGVSREVCWSVTQLNSVSSQCAHGQSSLAWKTEVHPKFFNGKKTFKKCNPPDLKFYLDKLNNKNFPHMVQC